MQNLSTDELYQIIGKNVAKIRKEKGLSQLDLSLQMGYKSVSIVSGAEIYYNGKHFNLEHLLKISQILDVNICDFLEPFEWLYPLKWLIFNSFIIINPNI